ncbi:ArsR/SmtB family transcription factor [Halorubrum distributum]|uniref:Transcriptional regulator n=1 Tax=Halorubrum distributum JCM 10247 TaxID=1227486 RepID=M0DP30_9EURY|nr:winged helix-turn-helix domain-containing protein [Halorubrum terrestre]ELZ36568.1 transcriptional regulator [Halorubrum terrestre JCM 10247]
MATTADLATEPSPDGDGAQSDDSEGIQTAGSARGLLELLDNEHTQHILKTLCRGPKRGRDLIDACEASRATIYRRLNRLEATGLVTTELYVDPDGHHCEAYRLRLDRFHVAVESGTVSVTVQSTTEERRERQDEIRHSL